MTDQRLMSVKGNPFKSPFLNEEYDPDDCGCSWQGMYGLMRCEEC